MRSSTWDSMGSPQVPLECSSVLCQGCGAGSPALAACREQWLLLWELLCALCSGSAAASNVQTNSNRSREAANLPVTADFQQVECALKAPVYQNI